MRVSFWGGLTLMSAVLACGCGQSTGTLTGKVTYNNQPLKGGHVTFVPAKGRTVVTEIKPDGTYTAEGVPEGEVQVAVETESMKPPAVPAYGPPPGVENPTGYNPSAQAGSGERYVKIPPEYADAATSNLKVTVTGGDQTYDIQLK